MLGIWTEEARIFGRISLETFCLNLIMVLLLGLFVFPLLPTDFGGERIVFG